MAGRILHFNIQVFQEPDVYQRAFTSSEGMGILVERGLPGCCETAYSRRIYPITLGVQGYVV